MPTTFIYGFEDWMDYVHADAARKNMSVPCDIIRVPQVQTEIANIDIFSVIGIICINVMIFSYVYM